MPNPIRRALPAVLALALFAAGLVAFATPAAQAHDIAVLSAGAFKPALLELGRAYQTRTGDTLTVTNDTAGGVTARIVRGEEADLIILPLAALEQLAAQGKLVANSVAPIAKSGIGIVVKKGSPPPDISTAEAFKRTMLAVPSFAYIDPASGGSSGIYLAQLFDRLGIAAEIKKKAVLVPGGLVASRVDDGEAALALQQISELRAVSGVTYVGPLPAELQSYTVYGAGIPLASRRPAAARALISFLRSEAAVQAMTTRGLESP